MPRGKAKSKWDEKKDTCEYLRQRSWCDLPKGKRCKYCLRITDGSKACEAMI